MFEPLERTVSELFKTYSTFNIPIYQRPYAWEPSQQIDDLWNDIRLLAEDESNPESQHFLGAMVLVSDSSKDRAVDVVDGQQRITTLTLLLAAWRDALRDEFDFPFPDSIQELLGYPEFRLKPQKSASSTLEWLLTVWPDPKARREFKPLNNDRALEMAYDRLRGNIRKFLQSKSNDSAARQTAAVRLDTAIRHRLTVLTLTSNDPSKAFTLFETLNTRGKDLLPSDLLKSRTISRHEPEEQESVAERWMTEIVGPFKNNGGSKDRSDERLMKYLRHYLMVELDSMIQKQDLYSKFAKLMDANPEHVLESLSEGAKIYSRLMSGTNTTSLKTLRSPKIENILDRLRRTKVVTHNILVFQALRTLGNDHPNLISLLLAIERLSIRWSIAGYNAQELENHYRKAAVALRTADDPHEAVAGILEILRRTACEEVASETFKSNIIKTKPAPDFAKYLLTLLVENLGSNTLAVTHLWASRQTQLEQIAPKKPDTTSGWHSMIPQDEYGGCVDLWGNYTLLTGATNIDTGNLRWVSKSTLYAKSSIDITRDLAPLETWDSDHILERTKWLAEQLDTLTSDGAAFSRYSDWIEG